MKNKFFQHSGEDLWNWMSYGTPLPKLQKSVDVSPDYEDALKVMESTLEEDEDWELVEDIGNLVITSRARLFNLQKKKWMQSMKSYNTLYKIVVVKRKATYINISEFIEENFGIDYDVNNLPPHIIKNVSFANDRNHKVKKS